MSARAVVAVAGMEGALASVVGGLVDCPVIAVPTSVGDGASFNGLSALVSMLNACASGISVLNIDNGFGAGFLASRINLMEGIKAVSYTHLDVYKRQTPHCRSGPWAPTPWPRRPC